MLNNKTFTVVLQKNPRITMNIVSGHFATANSHMNYYMDMSTLKTSVLVAKNIAREMAIPYLANTIVDTIVCMENTEVIGAYLAEELSHSGVSVMNSSSEISIVKPINSVDRKLVFHDNVRKMVSYQNVILLLASVSSGKTVTNAVECIEYYGGKLVGISTLFSAVSSGVSYDIHPLFTSANIPNYKLYNADECAMCESGQKLDAIVHSEGYTEI